LGLKLEEMTLVHVEVARSLNSAMEGSKKKVLFSEYHFLLFYIYNID
jgi:hypothetical protein